MLEQYERLTDQAQEAIISGELETASSLLAQAEAVAMEAGDRELADQAFCRRCYPLHELDRLGANGELARLKRILLSSHSPANRYLAAYYAALAYDGQNDREKARAYADRAVHLADQLNEPRRTAEALHLLGTFELLSSRFQEAGDAYGRALELFEAGNQYHELMFARIQDNLGYALICVGQYDRGISLCEQARSSMDECGAQQHVHVPLQDLCYGYMITDRLDEAAQAGERGLELALAIDDRLVVKNLHYLLAEIAVRNGDRFRARRFLNDLATYYPELPYSEEIVDLLLETDFSLAVNLRG